MQGLAAAAVEDCSQFIAKYIDYDMLRSYDRTTQQSGWTRWGISDDLSNSTCVFNRGVLPHDDDNSAARRPRRAMIYRAAGRASFSRTKSEGSPRLVSRPRL